MSEKLRAEQIIVEIVRKAGGELKSKTKLFKTFYYAHLEYTKANPGYLSNWPIVRMPYGPGIDQFDSLIGDLMVRSVLHLGHTKVGPHDTFCVELADASDTIPPLPVPEQAAIAAAFDKVYRMTATEASEQSHIDSRSWRLAENGDELSIYSDLISDEEYEKNLAAVEQWQDVFTQRTKS